MVGSASTRNGSVSGARQAGCLTPAVRRRAGKARFGWPAAGCWGVGLGAGGAGATGEPSAEGSR